VDEHELTRKIQRQTAKKINGVLQCAEVPNSVFWDLKIVLPIVEGISLSYSGSPIRSTVAKPY
jgi:hypothetical protein